MIQANELRIGNYFKAEPYSFDILQVKALGTEWVIIDNGSLFYKSIQPILLTEEWLLKFGFKKNEFTIKFSVGLFWCANNCDDSYYIDFDEDFGGFYIGLNGYGYLKNVNYVHQLQNLYFALTNNELNIQL